MLHVKKILPLLVLSLWAGSAHSDPRHQQAEDALVEARRQYYQGLATAQTPEQRDELYRKTLAPAEKNLGDVITQNWKEAIAERTRPGYWDASLAIEDSTWKEAALAFNKDPQDSGSQASSTSGVESSSHLFTGGTGGAPSVKPAAKDEKGLDGSEIPRLLEFGAKKRKAESGSTR